MLKVFGAIIWLMGLGGLMYAASTSSSITGASSGPSWLYSRF